MLREQMKLKSLNKELFAFSELNNPDDEYRCVVSGYASSILTDDKLLPNMTFLYDGTTLLIAYILLNQLDDLFQTTDISEGMEVIHGIDTAKFVISLKELVKLMSDSYKKGIS